MKKLLQLNPNSNGTIGSSLDVSLSLISINSSSSLEYDSIGDLSALAFFAGILG
jgi:hypothetical protein